MDKIREIDPEFSLESLYLLIREQEQEYEDLTKTPEYLAIRFLERTPEVGIYFGRRIRFILDVSTEEDSLRYMNLIRKYVGDPKLSSPWFLGGYNYGYICNLVVNPDIIERIHFLERSVLSRVINLD